MSLPYTPQPPTRANAMSQLAEASTKAVLEEAMADMPPSCRRQNMNTGRLWEPRRLQCEEVCRGKPHAR